MDLITGEGADGASTAKPVHHWWQNCRSIIMPAQLEGLAPLCSPGDASKPTPLYYSGASGFRVVRATDLGDVLDSDSGALGSPARAARRACQGGYPHGTLKTPFTIRLVFLCWRMSSKASEEENKHNASASNRRGDDPSGRHLCHGRSEPVCQPIGRCAGHPLWEHGNCGDVDRNECRERRLQRVRYRGLQRSQDAPAGEALECLWRVV